MHCQHKCFVFTKSIATFEITIYFFYLSWLKYTVGFFFFNLSIRLSLVNFILTLNLHFNFYSHKVITISIYKAFLKLQSNLHAVKMHSLAVIFWQMCAACVTRSLSSIKHSIASESFLLFLFSHHQKSPHPRPEVSTDLSSITVE